jgi:hypothetical protein
MIEGFPNDLVGQGRQRTFGTRDQDAFPNQLDSGRRRFDVDGVSRSVTSAWSLPRKPRWSRIRFGITSRLAASMVVRVA